MFNFWKFFEFLGCFFILVSKEEIYVCEFLRKKEINLLLGKVKCVCNIESEFGWFKVKYLRRWWVWNFKFFIVW